MTEIYSESEALLACLQGNEEAALVVIRDLLPNERRALADAAVRLAELANPRSWCPRCRQYAPLRGAGRVLLSRGWYRWHEACHDAAVATGEF